MHKDVRTCKGNIWKREVIINIDDNKYTGRIDSLGNDGVLIRTRNSSYHLKGKTIFISMQCEDNHTVKPAEIDWSDEWGFGARFI